MSLHSRVGAGVWRLATLSWAAAPRHTLLCLSETLGVLVQLLQPVGLALLLTGLATGSRNSVLVSIVLLAGQLALSRVLFSVGLAARVTQMERMGREFDGRVAKILGRMPTLESMLQLEFQEKLQLLREGRGSLGLGINATLNGLNTLVGVVGIIALAVTADARMLIVAAVSTLTILSGPLVARFQARAERDGASGGQAMQSLGALIINPSDGLEPRVNHQTRSLVCLLSVEVARWRRPRERAAVGIAISQIAPVIVFYLIGAVVLLWIVKDVLGGSQSLASGTLCIVLFQQLDNVTNSIRGAVSNLTTANRLGNRFIWLESYADRQASSRLIGSLSLPVQLKDVCFRYPGASSESLSNISLQIDRAVPTVLLGENGSGKTTLMALVAGLLEPTAGSVTYGDGENASTISRPDLWGRLSGAFQDSWQLESEISESIGIGDVTAMSDMSTVRRAASAGGALEFIERWPDKLKTRLGGQWEGGVVPSGGQWQRIGLARGHMRRQPLMRLLDEPAAALDPVAEAILIPRFLDVASADGTTLLVTHRLANLPPGAQIVVLGKGRIIEIGTHNQLLAIGGEYATLYALQSHGFQQDVPQD